MSATNIQSTAPQSRWQELEECVRELCVRVSFCGDSAGMARELGAIAPKLPFREPLVRGGWYRLGGVVDRAGNRVAGDIERWAEDELAAHGDDFLALAEAHAGAGLRPTRLIGRTHYWVATTGDTAADFLQVEIEELQEVVGSPLFEGDEPPSSIDELIDGREPRRPERGAAELAGIPLGPPICSLRRITDVAGFLERMRAQRAEPQPVHRFLEAWDKSSAGHVTRFANHWVLAVREHLDRYRQPILQATPVPALNGTPPRFDGGFGIRGRTLGAALQQFDRQAGYPMAWFFHMLTTRAVPHAVAAAVVEDMLSTFAYLPERDVQVVKEWLFKPYGF